MPLDFFTIHFYIWENNDSPMIFRYNSSFVLDTFTAFK